MLGIAVSRNMRIGVGVRSATQLVDQPPGSSRRSRWGYLRLWPCRLPISFPIGNVGLMQGVKKFEPDRGFRLATYAMWWIKASIQEFILRSWSLVKMGTTGRAEEAVLQLCAG